MIRLVIALALLLLFVGQTHSPSVDIPITVTTTGTETLVGIRNLKNWDTGSTPTGFYQTIEQCFASGAVSSTQIAEPRKGDGTTVMTNWQADNRILWPDNSLRCARYTFKYPSQLAASGTDTIKFYSKTGSWSNTPWAVATTTILAQDFLMQVVISATTYTCGVNNEINRGNYYQFDTGPTAVGLVIHGVFRNGTGSSSTDQGALHCRIYVVAFENGTFKVWGRADSCRSSNATCAKPSVTSAALKNGASSLWSSGAFTFFGGTYFATADADGQPYYSGTDVRKVIAGFPAMVLANPETTNLWDAKVTPFMKTTPTVIGLMDPSLLGIEHATQPISYTPIGLGDYNGINLNGTGGHYYVGIMTAQSGMAMFTGNWITMRQDAIDALSGGAQQWHFRDATNGNPLNMNGGTTYSGTTQNANVSWCVSGGAPSIVITGYATGDTPYGNSGFQGEQKCDTSHIPSFYQFQMFYSGEEWWLDQYQDQVIGEIGSRNEGTICYARNPILNHQWWAVGGMLFSQETRGQGWFIRDSQNIAWMTPTVHPLYQYMQDIVSQYWGMADDWLTAPNGMCSAAGIPWTPDVLSLGIFPTNIAPWMYDYWGYGASMALLRGQVTSSNRAIIYPMTKFVIGRAYNGCAYSAGAAYNFSFTINNATALPWATLWSQVYAGVDNATGSWGVMNPGGPLLNLDGTGCPSSPSGILSTNYTAGMQPFTYGDGMDTYANFFLRGALLAKQAGIAGAAAMVTYYDDARNLVGCCTNTAKATWPQYAIEEPQ